VTEPRGTYLLRQADRALVLSQRLAEWIAHAPSIEEDLALANLGLDLLGQARTIYQQLAAERGDGLTEDDLAYERTDREYANVLLVEQPNGDFAVTMVRQLLHDAYAAELWEALRSSTDPFVAGLAAKAVKETAYHLRHSRTWVVRLGDGTEESHRRAQAAVDELWRFTAELFEADEVEDALVATGVAADPAALRSPWNRRVEATFAEAGLRVPEEVAFRTGGRHGLHDESFSHLLDELGAVRRRHPGATW
jgi:ring-1,2-phenylacetyl-CoA epoxidase subunit PaaC